LKYLTYRILASLLTLFSATLFAQNNLDKVGLSGTAPSSAAYGLRLLSSSYSGNAIQVRRSSDNTTQSIGFTVNGDLDTNALKSFTGAGDAFISIWYDQSGNAKDLSQPTAIYQPAIVSSGIIYRENTKPFIRFFGFIGSANFKALVLATQMTVVGHVSAVHRFEPTGDGFILGHTGVYYWHSNPVSTLISNTYASASVKGGSGWTNGIAYAPISMPWPSVLSINEIAPLTASSFTNWDNIGTDRITAHNTTGGGGYSELIIFPAALSVSNRHILEANQASYFGITVILPVTWISFTGKAGKNTARLDWQTAVELDTKEFTVQRRSNNGQWVNIAIVPAAGSSNESRKYNYIDEHPFVGSNYYRILETDLDDKTSYSKTIQLIIEGDLSAFSIMNNPVTNGLLQIQSAKQQVLSLYNAEGKLIWKRQLDYGLQIIQLGATSKGIYFLKGDEKTVKLIVQ